MNKAIRDYMSKLGKRGGKARAAILTPERRSEIARTAGKAKGKGGERKQSEGL